MARKRLPCSLLQPRLVTFATGEAILHNLYGEQLWSGLLGTGTFCRVQGLAMVSANDWTCSLIDYYGDGTERAYTRVPAVKSLGSGILRLTAGLRHLRTAAAY